MEMERTERTAGTCAMRATADKNPTLRKMDKLITNLMFCANNLNTTHQRQQRTRRRNKKKCQLYFQFYSRLTYKLILSKSFASGIRVVFGIHVRTDLFFHFSSLFCSPIAGFFPNVNVRSDRTQSNTRSVIGNNSTECQKDHKLPNPKSFSFPNCLFAWLSKWILISLTMGLLNFSHGIH